MPLLCGTSLLDLGPTVFVRTDVDEDLHRFAFGESFDQVAFLVGLAAAGRRINCLDGAYFQDEVGVFTFPCRLLNTHCQGVAPMALSARKPMVILVWLEADATILAGNSVKMHDVLPCVRKDIVTEIRLSWWSN